MDSLVLAEPGSTLLDLSPFPESLPAAESTAKLLVVSLRVQAFAAYEAGHLVRWGPISSGAPSSPTPIGLFHVNWRAKVHVSTIDSTWIMPWCVNIDAAAGIALHQYALPGVPASHCCIRLLEDDAHWIFEWVDPWSLSRDQRVVLARGTPVAVFGSYEFEAPPPWRWLPADAEATMVPSSDIETLFATRSVLAR